MRICVVLDDSFYSPNGVQQIVRSLSAQWVGAGHSVTVLCGGQAGESGVTTDFDVVGASRLFRMRVNGNRVDIPIRVNRSLVRNVVALGNFDVLHVQAPYGPISHAAVLASQPGTRIVASFHIAVRGRFERMGLRAMRVAYRRSLDRIDEFSSDSPESARTAAETWGIEARVIPNAVSALPRGPGFAHNPSIGDASEHFKLLFLGRLVERKGCQDLLAAVRMLPASQRRQVSIGIVGNGPMEPMLRRMAANLGTHVEFLGFVDEDRKAEMLGNSDLAVFPAKAGESFGVVLLEAMSAGVPFVGYANGGYQYVAGGDNQSLVEPGDIEGLANVIARCIDDPQFRMDLREEQADRLQAFEPSEIADRYLAFFSPTSLAS